MKLPALLAKYDRSTNRPTDRRTERDSLQISIIIGQILKPSHIANTFGLIGEQSL